MNNIEDLKEFAELVALEKELKAKKEQLLESACVQFLDLGQKKVVINGLEISYRAEQKRMIFDGIGIYDKAVEALKRVKLLIQAKFPEKLTIKMSKPTLVVKVLEKA